MVSAIVHFKLENYNEWRPLFDGLSSARKEIGSMGGTLFRSTGNPNEVIVIMHWKDLASAHEYCDMPDWRSLMQSNSVSGVPEIFYSDLSEEVAS
jgi:quinol monooxygenase YgiN